MVTGSIFPLTIESLSVRRRGKTILRDISVRLKEGGFTMVMGPNGAGKTTFLRALHGLERPASGTIAWNLNEHDARNRRALVFQTPIMMRRTLLQNIAYPLQVRGIKKAVALEQAEDWAGRVGLGDSLHRDATHLSGGERQKLAIARALVTGPDILLLDEPATNLDGAATREIEAILKDAHKNGATIIMATHDIGQAKRLSSDVIFFHNGRLTEHSASPDFFKKPGSEPAQAYLKGEIVE